MRRGEGSSIDVTKLLEQLEALVEDRWHFMEKAWGVDLEEFYRLTQRIRQALPDDIKRASRLAKDSERIRDQAHLEAEQILERAKKEAERLVTDARAEAARLVDNHEITRLASAQAREVIARAEKEAGEMQRGAEQYAGDVLSKLEDQTATIMTAIKKGQERLERGTGSG